MDHPNIVKYLDDYEFDGKRSTVMELIETGNLSTLIEEDKLANKAIPEDLILSLFSQLVSELKYCYDERIIHLDVKPKNILYLKSIVVKLADFGIAINVSENQLELDSSQESDANSYSYVSPEVAPNDYYSFPTDVCGIGVIMYQMMTLELPFN
jgi:serine/threonine-protein kinase